MKERNLIKIHTYLFEFSTLFHQKFAPIFQKHKKQKYECNKNQNKALFMIKRKNNITPTTLGKCLDMKKGSLTTLIDSLEEMKLVYRLPDSNDRRKVLLSLTDEGERYIAERQKESKEIITNVFSKLNEGEVEEFASSLQTVVNILRKI